MELGIAFSVYGITAFLSYLPGGYLQIKFLQIFIIFIFTLDLIGRYFLYDKSRYLWFICIWVLGCYYNFFSGFTLIKATRSVAGNNQGISFGALEAGRGLIASLCASIAVFLYSNNSSTRFLTNIISKNLSPLSIVIFFYSCACSIINDNFIFFKEEVKQTKATKIKYNIGDIFKNKNQYYVFQ